MDPELLKRIDALAEKVGQTGERLFASLVQREAVAGWTWLVISTLTLAVCAFIIIASFRAERAEVAKGADTDDCGVYYGGMVISTLIALSLLFLAIPTCIVQIASPEAAALKTLLGK